MNVFSNRFVFENKTKEDEEVELQQQQQKKKGEKKSGKEEKIRVLLVSPFSKTLFPAI